MSGNNINISIDWNDKTILIVEDNWANAELLKYILRSTKAHLIFNKNSTEFFETIKTTSDINIILMDINLGESDYTGIDLKKYLVDNNYNIPVILQTAYDSTQFYDDNTLHKPIVKENLFKLMIKLIK